MFRGLGVISKGVCVAENDSKQILHSFVASFQKCELVSIRTRQVENVGVLRSVVHFEAQGGILRGDGVSGGENIAEVCLNGCFAEVKHLAEAIEYALGVCPVVHDVVSVCCSLWLIAESIIR